MLVHKLRGFPLWLSWQRICLQCGRSGFDPWVGKIPCRRERLPAPVFWPGEFHGLYSHGLEESWTWLSNFHFHTSKGLGIMKILTDLEGHLVDKTELSNLLKSSINISLRNLWHDINHINMTKVPCILVAICFQMLLING